MPFSSESPDSEGPGKSLDNKNLQPQQASDGTLAGDGQKAARGRELSRIWKSTKLDKTFMEKINNNELELADYMEKFQIQCDLEGVSIGTSLVVFLIAALMWNPAKRPSMSKVVQKLTTNFQSLEMHLTPFVPSSDQPGNVNVSTNHEMILEVCISTNHEKILED
ncbi:hypothetical protein M5K25_027802 [Dendrobium thyrsiflorum]|uniref:Uncharacterized protein n=1 Tax=Dendrobium thyrsiflorum TaxID=117978 RepID=A0ABD0TUS2_DENTH